MDQDDEPDPLDEVDVVVFEPKIKKWKAQHKIVRQSRCTESQRRCLASLRLEIGFYGDEWEERLGAYCKKELRDLSYAEAEDLEKKLRIRLRDKGTLFAKRERQEQRFQRGYT